LTTGLMARVAAALCAVTLSSWSVPGRADVVTLAASRDNTLFEEDGALSNGAGDHIFAGLTKDGVRRRALIAFDVAGALPAGSTISAVTLRLYLSKTQAQIENGHGHGHGQK
jgi:hypothetical protein